MTPERLHILQHALGLDQYGQGSWYRNHFCSGPQCDNYGDCRALVEAGLMVEHSPRELFGGDSCFVVTAAGKAAVRELSLAPPRTSRAKERYRRWLRSGVDLPFGEWLKGGAP